MRLLALVGIFMLNACTVLGPDFKRPEVPWLTNWSGGSLESLAVEKRSQPRAHTEEWWRNFNDPVLDQMVAEAQRLNPDVRIAGMRIMEARAQLAIADSTLYPQQRVLNAEVLRTGTRKSGGESSSFNLYNAGALIGWELDFWGKFRRSIESADASYFASIAQYDDMQVLMAAQVASFYSSIRIVEARLQIVKANAALQKRSLEITELLFRRGNQSELDMQQAKAQYLSTLATIPEIEGSLRQTQNALSVLLARAPGPLPEMAAGKEQIPQAELDVIADLPTDLLRRRPDVRAAEMQLAAQSALIGVSQADLYPSISLTGSLGLQSTSLPGATSTLLWGIGPALIWNILDYDRLSNKVLVQDARFQQLYEGYQGTVLQAAREVDDAAVGFAKNREQIGLMEETVKAAQRSLEIATIQYREGLTDFQRVISSQQTLLAQQDRLVTTRGNVALKLITLYKAMGGGWQQGRARPVLDDATRETMAERSAWKEMLKAPLPPPGTDLQQNIPGTGEQ